MMFGDREDLRINHRSRYCEIRVQGASEISWLGRVKEASNAEEGESDWHSVRSVSERECAARLR